MARCGDCIHYEVCYDRSYSADWCKVRNEVEKHCEYFKDDSCFVKLPCKVGDTVYRIGSGDYSGEIFEWDVEHIEIYADELVIIDDSDNVISPCEIHKTVFLTREEAEKALAEQKGENHD